MKNVRLFFGTTLFGPFPCLIHAQTTTGRLAGTVSDPSGAAINNADVVITNEHTGAQRVLHTGPDGLFTVVSTAF